MSACLSSMHIKNQDLKVLKRIRKVPADLNVQLANSNSYTSSLPRLRRKRRVHTALAPKKSLHLYL